MVRYVLDSTAFIEWPVFPQGELYIPPRVSSEAKSLPSQLKLDKVKIQAPSKQSRDLVFEALKETGNFISETDIDVIALSLDLKAILVSDDYSVQNVCAFVGVKFMPLSKPGILEKKIFRLRCTSCGCWVKGPVCETCGGKARKQAWKTSKLDNLPIHL